MGAWVDLVGLPARGGRSCVRGESGDVYFMHVLWFLHGLHVPINIFFKFIHDFKIKIY